MDDNPGMAPPVVAVDDEDEDDVRWVQVTLDGRFLAGDGTVRGWTTLMTT